MTNPHHTPAPLPQDTGEAPEDQLYQVLAETIPHVIWLGDPDGAVRYLNPAYEALTGRPVADALGWGWTEDLHPGDRGRALLAWEQAWRKGRPMHGECRVRARDGSWRTLECVARPVHGRDGAVTGWVGINTDITERKQAERALRIRGRQQAAVAELGQWALSSTRLQDVLDAAVAAIAETLDADCCKVLELQPDGLALLLRAGVGWQEGRVGQAMVPAEAGSQAGYTLARSEPVITMDMSRETRFTAPELLLEHDIVSGASCVIPGPGGRPWGVLGVHTCARRTFTRDDVHFVAAMANVLAAAIERDYYTGALQAADRRKDEFLAMLAHELRNPLAPIANAAHVLGRVEAAAPELQWARDMVARQVKHLSRLVDDLLDVSRIARGKVELRREPLDLAAVADQAMECARPLLERRGQSLRLALAEGPLRLEGDPVRLVQVLLNVLDNAAKYSPPGAEIGLALRRDGMEAVVEVTDPGAGIDPALLPRVFDLFQQGERRLEEGRGGLGIGLTLVRRLVDLHGGTVDVHSDGAGRGTTVAVRLPLPSQAPADPPPVDHAPDGPRVSVLVVDDEPDVADSMGLLLESLGHRVRVAYGGEDAVRAARLEPPDLVLLDLGLAGADGCTVARELRALPCGARLLLVALTGYGDDAARLEARAAGFDRHVLKPMPLETLHDLLATAARQHLQAPEPGE
jgi:PAS domain S-box-containing protein